MADRFISVKGASEHNLKHVSLDIPLGKLVAVTGVSGSGKSSLAYDTVFREAQRRYLETFSNYARLHLGKAGYPEVDEIKGLHPALSVSQNNRTYTKRSTVGTLSGIYDNLRMLFSRASDPGESQLPAGAFSFNNPGSVCPACSGIGEEVRVDPELLVGDPAKSLRDGCLIPTTDSGYIVYSQVTMDVLNDVCRAHSFDVDKPWEELTDEEKQVVFWGSDRIIVPYGKHTLESRMKWKGITAAPRKEGHYKGIATTIADILKKNRSDNILRFARTQPCSSCNGDRLDADARMVKVMGHTIGHYTSMPLRKLYVELSLIQRKLVRRGNSIVESAASSIIKNTYGKIQSLIDLGLSHLTLHRLSSTLSSGEVQRIRLASEASGNMSDILYVLDEPAAGLHSHERQKVAIMLRALVERGNSVLVIEHDPSIILGCDWCIDVGPYGGIGGGSILFNGSIKEFLSEKGPEESPTRNYLKSLLDRVDSSAVQRNFKNSKMNQSSDSLMLESRDSLLLESSNCAVEIKGASLRNLENIDLKFLAGKVNVVTGVSGAGKTTLISDVVSHIVSKGINDKCSTSHEDLCQSLTWDSQITAVVEVDRKPLGRNSRSNCATYTGLFDEIRKIFAKSDAALEGGFSASDFSFNVKSGRCENCEGAGTIEIPLQLLESSYLVCPHCRGRRFKDEILAIRWKGYAIDEVLDMSVSQALSAFASSKKATSILQLLNDLGLGYLALGQPSPTVSGGEAQRIKLATKLAKRGKGNTLYILDEPSTGLHHMDAMALGKALKNIADLGDTVIVADHNLDLISCGDYIIDLGPSGGVEGGEIMGAGNSRELMLQRSESKTGEALYRHFHLKDYFVKLNEAEVSSSYSRVNTRLNGISTNNLKSINLNLPDGRMTVLTGLSGTGKSSLAFDTLYSESRRQYTESLSSYGRRFMESLPQPDIDRVVTIGPVAALGQKSRGHGRKGSDRSTVSTMTGIDYYLRLLYSRYGGTGLSLSHFSFNHPLGSCSHCEGLGYISQCSKVTLVKDGSLPVFDGALSENKRVGYYIDPEGQHRAVLKIVASTYSLDFSLPLDELSEDCLRILFYGTGDEKYDAHWEYDRGGKHHVHEFSSPWNGLCHLIEEEYFGYMDTRKGKAVAELIEDVDCDFCNGLRINSDRLNTEWRGIHFENVLSSTVDANLEILQDTYSRVWGDSEASNRGGMLRRSYGGERLIVHELLRRFKSLASMGLSYLTPMRSARTLSSGEARRIELASHLSRDLSGVTIVLDEPTLGLHPMDSAKLISNLNRLKDDGNTLLVIEHDPQVWKAADHLIELGPRGGKEGGYITFKGTCDEIMKRDASPSGRVLRNLENHDHHYPGEQYVKALLSILPSLNSGHIEKTASEIGFAVFGASLHNLKDIDFSIEPYKLTALVGVSGAGKSTLLFDVVEQSLAHNKAVGCSSIRGACFFSSVVSSRQIPRVGSLSTALSWLGVDENLRNIYASVKEAKVNKFKKSRFSFNGKSGQCPLCKGAGVEKISMDFLGNIEAPCSSCNGLRFEPETLTIRYRYRNIGEFLQMSCSEAIGVLKDSFKDDSDAIGRVLKLMEEAGLGYMELGRSLSTYSGGELQRLELVRALATGQKDCLYLFDEPTRGLHPLDVLKLVNLLRKISNEGNTVCVVEHNEQFISVCDTVVELGPVGGPKGGFIVGTGDK